MGHCGGSRSGDENDGGSHSKYAAVPTGSMNVTEPAWRRVVGRRGQVLGDLYRSWFIGSVGRWRGLRPVPGDLAGRTCPAVQKVTQLTSPFLASGLLMLPRASSSGGGARRRAHPCGRVRVHFGSLVLLPGEGVGGCFSDPELSVFGRSPSHLLGWHRGVPPTGREAVWPFPARSRRRAGR